MSVSLATQNPDAFAKMSDPTPLPKQATLVLFKPRPSEMRAGMVTVPALVMKVDEANRLLDLLLIYDVDDMRRLDRVAEHSGEDQGWVAPEPHGVMEISPAQIEALRALYVPVGRFQSFIEELGDKVFGAENETPETSLYTLLIALTARVEALEKAAKPKGRGKG